MYILYIYICFIYYLYNHNTMLNIDAGNNSLQVLILLYKVYLNYTIHYCIVFSIIIKLVSL